MTAIRLENVQMAGGAKGGPRKLFEGLNLCIEPGARIGILGLPKSGKTTLLRLVCGTERNYTGTITGDMKCSWPIPFDGFFAPTSSIAWSLRWVARLYGVNDPDFASRIARMAQAHAYVNMPSAECPGPIKTQFAFALPLAMDFDLYLFDNVSVPGPKEFRDIGKSLVAEHTAGRATVIATGNEKEIEGNCRTAYVLENGRATYFADAEEAAKYFRELKKAEEARQKPVAEKGEAEEESVSSDLEAGGVDMVGAVMADM